MEPDIFIKGPDGNESLVTELIRFNLSPDHDEPDCLCSLCRLNFKKDPEVDPDLWDEDNDYELPIRLFFNAGKDGEARFHQKCFEQVFEIVNGQFVERLEVTIRWVEDNRYTYMFAGPTCEECDHPSCQDLRYLRINWGGL